MTEPLHSSQNPNDVKTKLIELGLFEKGMTVKDMLNLLSAVENSHFSANAEMCNRDINSSAATTGMKRNYISVPERRMPWSIFSNPEQLSVDQRARILAAYKEQQRVYRYRKSKTSLAFTEWNNSTISIPFCNTKMVTDFHSDIRQSRSGRLLKSAPQYVDDGSDGEAPFAKKKSKKKTKKLTDNDICQNSTLSKEEIVEKSLQSTLSIKNDVPKNSNFNNNLIKKFVDNDLSSVNLNNNVKSHNHIQEIKKDTLNATNRAKRMKMSTVE